MVILCFLSLTKWPSSVLVKSGSPQFRNVPEVGVLIESKTSSDDEPEVFNKASYEDTVFDFLVNCNSFITCQSFASTGSLISR